MLQRPALGACVAVGTGGRGLLLLDAATERVHSLNLTASLVVELCDGSRGIEAIRKLVEPLIPEEERPGVAAWMRRAAEEGLLVEAGSGFPALDVGEWIELSARLRSEGRVLASYLARVKVRELLPDDPDQHAELGELAHILGRRDEARECYEFYFSRRPDDAEIEHVLIGLRDEPPPSRASDRCVERLYARFAGNYDESMCDDLSYQAPDRLEETLRRALGSRRSLRALDLGCGTGLSGMRVRDWASRLTGIDLSAEMLERAAGRGVYDELIKAEITGWLAGRGPDAPRYDLITACDALIYFGDLAQVLGPARRLLDPGGIFVLTVEKADAPPFRLTDSGRFVHHADHIRAVAKAEGYRVLWIDEVFLRYEYGEPVVGLAATLFAPNDY